MGPLPWAGAGLRGPHAPSLGHADSTWATCSRTTASLLLLALLTVHMLQLMTTAGSRQALRLPDARDRGDAFGETAQTRDRKAAAGKKKNASQRKLGEDSLETFKDKFRSSAGARVANASSLFAGADAQLESRACSCRQPNKKELEKQFFKGGKEWADRDATRWSCSARKPRGRTKQNLQTAWAVHSGDDGLVYTHMPFLARLPNRSLIMAYQASEEHEGAKDQHVRIAVSKDERGGVWFPSFEVPTLRMGAQWGPVLHVDETRNRLWLFYTESKSCLRPSRVTATGTRVPEKWLPGGDIFATSIPLPSAKSPLTPDKFQPPRLLYSETADNGIPKVLAGKLLVLRNGNWILPFWREKHTILGVCESNQEGSAGVLVSEDHGESWRAYGHIKHPSTWLIEGAVAQAHASDRLIMLFRTSAGTGTLYFSTSEDSGRTWSTPAPSSLPSPGAKVALSSVNDRAMVLVFNNHRRLAYPLQHSRTDLDIVVSTDDGKTWGTLHRLEGLHAEGRMFHYPSILQLSSCKIAVAYTASSLAMSSGEGRSVTDFAPYGIRIAVVNADLM